MKAIDAGVGGPPRGGAVRALLALLLATAACTAEPARPTKEAAATMPNGTWTLSANPPADAVSLCPEFLPTGTRVKLALQGPTRQALEEQRGDELGGSFTLLAPWSAALCGTGLGAASGFGVNLCEAGRPRPDRTGDVLFEDAVFNLSRLSAPQAKDPDYAFFAERGARAGARFMLLTLKDKGLQWRLWLKSSNEMLGECVATLPGKNNIDSFPMTWRLK